MQLEPERRRIIEGAFSTLDRYVTQARGILRSVAFDGLSDWASHLRGCIDTESKEEVLKAVQSAQDGIEGILNENSSYTSCFGVGDFDSIMTDLNIDFNTIRNLLEGDFEVAPHIFGHHSVTKILAEYPNPCIRDRMRQAEEAYEEMVIVNDRLLTKITKSFEGNDYVNLAVERTQLGEGNQNQSFFLTIELKPLPREKLNGRKLHGKKIDPIEDLEFFFEGRGLTVHRHDSEISRVEYAESYPDYKLGCFASMFVVPYFLLTFDSLKRESFEKAYMGINNNRASDRLVIEADGVSYLNLVEHVIDNSSNSLSAFSQKMEKTLNRVSPPER